jgi:hypothetical protein
MQLGSDIVAIANLRASIVVEQREFDEPHLSTSASSDRGEASVLDAHEEFVIRRFAVLSLSYHQALHRHYGSRSMHR